MNMSTLLDLDLLFNKLDKLIEKKHKQIIYVHDKNIQTIRNKFDLESLDIYSINSGTNNNSHNKLCIIRENMIKCVIVSLQEHMFLLDTLIDDEMNLGIKYMKSNLKFSRDKLLLRIDDKLETLQRIGFKLINHFQHIPFNLLDVLLPNRFDITAPRDLSIQSLINSNWSAISKELLYTQFEFEVIHTQDEYCRVRRVFSLNNNNFLIVLATNPENMLINRFDRIKLLNLKSQQSVKLNVAIGNPFSIRYSDYKVLCPKHTDRIVINFRIGGWNIGYRTFIHVYDYKLNLLFEKVLDEYYDDILTYKRLILCRSIFKRKLVFMNFLLQTLHVCELGEEFDDYHLKHFNCSMVYLNRTCEGRFFPKGGEFIDRIVIFDYFNKQIVKSIKFEFSTINKYDECLTNIQLSQLVSFDRESNIYMFDNNKKLMVYNKFGELIVTTECRSLRKIFRTMELMKKVRIIPNQEYEYSVVKTYNMN